MLENRIQELWAEAERLGRPVVAHKNPGVEVDFLERAFEQLIPSEVAAWFSWCNGISHYAGQVQNDAAIVPGYEPLSAAEAAAIREGYPHDPLLSPVFFPLLATGGGDFYAATSVPGTGELPVVSVTVGEETRVAYRSVEQMVATFVDCYRDRTFYVDDDGVLQADDDVWLAKEAGAAG